MSAARTQTQTQTQTQTTAMSEYDAAVTWQARSIELARHRGLLDKATYNGRNAEGQDVYIVPSGSQAYHVHLVRYHSDRNQMQCDCTAAMNGLPCSHCGATLEAMRAQDEMERESTRVWRQAAGF